MSLEALIFDVDGTLADTEEAHRQAFNAAFREHELGWEWSRRDYAGLLKVSGGKERIAWYVDSLAAAPAEKERLKELIRALHAAKTRTFAELVKRGSVRLRAGVARLLSEARAAGMRLAIASTTTLQNVESLIAANLAPDALAWFSVIATGDMVPAKKPAPDIYLLALDRLQLPAAQCIAFEDSAHGLAAAKAAGLYTVVAPTLWTAADDLAAADWLLDRFAEAGGLDELCRRHAHWLADRMAAA